MNNTIGIATPLNKEESIIMGPILSSSRYLDSKNLSLWLAQARRNGAHRAMKNQLMIGHSVENCRQTAEAATVADAGSLVCVQGSRGTPPGSGSAPSSRC